MELFMAQLQRSGSGIASLYEHDTTLAQVFLDIGLKPLSPREETALRLRLGSIIARAYAKLEVTQKINPNGRLTTRQMTQRLRAIERDPAAHQSVLRGTDTGFHESFEIEIALRIREHFKSSDSCDRLRNLAQASLAAAKELERTKGRSGRKSIDWFDAYTQILVDVADMNGIRATIVNDRSTGVPIGRFFDIASAMEMLLEPRMRAPSPGALGKRLSRSLARLSHRQN
jgi:hypothetical protein